MGFRSTFVTEHSGILEIFPNWFVKKWEQHVHFNNGNMTPISSKHEVKAYSTLKGIEEDIQAVLQDYGVFPFVLVWLHECGGITRVEISRNSIDYGEPASWNLTEGVEHYYCLDCSRLTPIDRTVYIPSIEKRGCVVGFDEERVEVHIYGDPPRVTHWFSKKVLEK